MHSVRLLISAFVCLRTALALDSQDVRYDAYGYLKRAPMVISTDQSCGAYNGSATCAGSSFGNCCSQFGYCGSTDLHCGSACQPEYGDCGIAAVPSSSSSTSSTPSTSLSATTSSACAPSTTPGWSAMGCYTDSVGARSLPYPAYLQGQTTIQGCLAACRAAGFKLAGLEYFYQCYCGDALQNGGMQAPADDTKCDTTPCQGNPTESCGGPDRLNMFSFGAVQVPCSSSTTAATATAASSVGSYQWSPLGCYSDDVNTRTLRVAIQNAGSIELCQAACRLGAYDLAGVEFGSECYCDRVVRAPGALAVDDGIYKCGTPCSSNTSEICGGPNRLSLYTYALIPVISTTTSASATTSISTIVTTSMSTTLSMTTTAVTATTVSTTTATTSTSTPTPVLTCPLPGTCAGEVLTNGGFEYGGGQNNVFGNWTTVAPNGGAQVNFVSRSPTTAHSGNAYAQYYVLSSPVAPYNQPQNWGGSQTLQQTVTGLSPGVEYLFSAYWMLQDVPAPALTCNITISLGNAGTIWFKNITPADGLQKSYSRICGSITPNSAADVFKVTTVCYGVIGPLQPGYSSTNTLQMLLDDLSLKPASCSNTLPIITDDSPPIVVSTPPTITDTMCGTYKTVTGYGSGKVTCPAPSSSDQKSVYLRVEGLTSTYFEGCISSGPGLITTPAGGTHVCNGQNLGLNAASGPGTTPLNVLGTAARKYGFAIDGPYDPVYQDFFIKSIGGESQTAGVIPWAPVLNTLFLDHDSSMEPGGCQVKVENNDRVTWVNHVYYDPSDYSSMYQGQLITSFDYAVVPVGGIVQIKISRTPFSYSNVFGVSGASIAGKTTDSAGFATLGPFNTAGCYQYRATWGNALKSSTVSITVTDAFK